MDVECSQQSNVDLPPEIEQLIFELAADAKFLLNIMLCWSHPIILSGRLQGHLKSIGNVHSVADPNSPHFRHFHA